MIIFNYLKIIFYNLLIFLILIIITDLIFGTWFTNNLKAKLASERNINRIYKFDFEFHKGFSWYKRDNFGFRIDKPIDPKNVDVVFVGGSTINQKFTNYDDTVVGLLQEEFVQSKKDYKIINAGVDGMSILGHINSFPMWFDQIENFKPKYYIFYIGINDLRLFHSFKENRKALPFDIDFLEENNSKKNLQEYMESNSFFYNQLRNLKVLLYLKYNIKIGIHEVNKRNFVYGMRLKKNQPINFIEWNEVETKFNKLSKEEIYWYELFKVEYLNKLKILTDLVEQRDAKIIFINQVSGEGIRNGDYFIGKTIIEHCDKENLLCLDLVKELPFEYNDFYDWCHLTLKGSKKVADYIYNNLIKYNF